MINESLGRIRKNRQWNNVFDLHENIRPSDSAEGATLRSTHHFEPEHQVLQTEIRHLIEQKLDTLPPLLRLVFILRAVEEMPSTEVATLLEIPKATVRTRFFSDTATLITALLIIKPGLFFLSVSYLLPEKLLKQPRGCLYWLLPG